MEYTVLHYGFSIVTETRKAIQLLSSDKGNSCRDLLPMAEKLKELFQYVSRKEAIPQEFKNASIIHLRKRKVNPQVCDNHKRISLLSIAKKNTGKNILNCLIVHLDQAGLIPESQCGSRKDRGTVDMIFAARQLQAKCGPLHDLCRPNQSIRHGQSRWALEKMAKFSCPQDS